MSAYEPSDAEIEAAAVALAAADGFTYPPAQEPYWENRILAPRRPAARAALVAAHAMAPPTWDRVAMDAASKACAELDASKAREQEAARIMARLDALDEHDPATSVEDSARWWVEFARIVDAARAFLSRDTARRSSHE